MRLRGIALPLAVNRKPHLVTRTFHALLIDPTGTITDLHLSTDHHTQARQVHDALGDAAQVVGYATHQDSSHTVAFAAELRDDLAPNVYAAFALRQLLRGSFAAFNLQGSVLFTAFDAEDRQIALSAESAAQLRTAPSQVQDRFPDAFRTEP